MKSNFSAPDICLKLNICEKIRSKELFLMSDIMKNISRAETLKLKDETVCQSGQVVSKTLVQNGAVSMTLFAFADGEEISTHESGGDAFAVCINGKGIITIDGAPHELCEGDAILMPARHPHAVLGKEEFKMLLTVVF